MRGLPCHVDSAGMRRRSATRITIRAGDAQPCPRPMPQCHHSKPVALPPGRARLSTKPAPTGSTTTREHDRHVAGRLQATALRALRHEARMTSGASATNSAACLRMSAALAVAQRVSMRTLRPMRPAQYCASPAGMPPSASLKLHIIRGSGNEHADTSNPLALLRTCCERPRWGHTAENRR